jgi:signal transduction histidine kinase
MEAGTRHTASYTNLSPGEYTFRVQGASAGGSWNEAGDLFGFFVAPFVWQTWWFRISAAAALISLGLAAHRYRTRRLLDLERLRLRIASDLHDDVGSNLSSIALLSEILHNQSRLDDVQRRQILRINQAAQETISSLRDIIWLVDPQHNELNDLLRKMRITAADLLNGTSHTFETSISLPAQQPGMTFMRNLLLIYKEALHNIARHSQAAHASIRMDETGGRLVLEIEDDGIGFDQARATTGRGLDNMRRRAEQAGGKLDIESRPGGGTRIRFSARMAQIRGSVAGTRDPTI